MEEQGNEHRVISYASRSLSDVERRYSQTKKEVLAIVWSCERFHAYLYGTEFELVTDHKPLECIFSPKSKPCARIDRWLLRMQPYTFRVKYLPGPKNIADLLSRLVRPKSASSEGPKENDYIKFVAREATPAAISTHEIERESEYDVELQVVRKCSLSRNWSLIEYKEYIPV